MNRRAFLGASLALPLLGRAVAASPASWPAWDAYATRFVSHDGRVIDDAAGGITTSEGQAYALFFALVARDRPRFERLLAWTRQNLAGGDLAARLPGWKWGLRDDGAWTLLDANAASDADVWLGYVLLEAARLFREAELARLGRAVLAQVAEREVAVLPGLGATLLPGPVGFRLDRDRARLNPSYAPPAVMRALARAGLGARWAEVAATSLRVLEGSAPHGHAPDWIAWEGRRGLVVDPAFGATSSYDAIRTILWAGALHRADPLRARLVARLGARLALARAGRVPEKVDARTGAASGEGPVGFRAALVPAARGTKLEPELLDAIDVADRAVVLGAPWRYYDASLTLFTLGFADGRWAFAPDGRLVVAWSARAA